MSTEREQLNEMRIALVTCIDNLIDLSERYAGRIKPIDPDEARYALGEVEHVRKIKARYSYNGPLQTPLVSPPAGDVAADQGYVSAFYALAMLMGIGARPVSPETVWKDEMLPRLKVALAAAPVAEPVAYRYKDSRGHWRYVGTPFTPGWEPPPNLVRDPLYSHAAQSCDAFSAGYDWGKADAATPSPSTAPVAQPGPDEDVAHHGVPLLTEHEAQICEAMSLWIATVRQGGSAWYKDWLPGRVDIEKSRLFWRLRSGKEPLPHRPPTAYSCPWYEVVEETDRPHWAFDGGHEREGIVSFAQCGYKVEDRDAAGAPSRVSFGPWQFRCWIGPAENGTHEGWWLQRDTPTPHIPVATGEK
jgi:hypothetical protein